MSYQRLLLTFASLSCIDNFISRIERKNNHLEIKNEFIKIQKLILDLKKQNDN